MTETTNTGNYNTGDYNTGNRNTGYRNTGYYNTENRNTGYCNTGNYNTGDCNTGHYNTGNRNTGYYNTGLFMTTTPEKVPAFNAAMVDRREFLNARPGWMKWLPTTIWISSADMTDQEKADNPTHETTGGYLRELTMQEAFAQAWANDEDKDVSAVEALPGFDRDVWLEITGLDLWAEEPEVEVNPKVIVIDGARYVLDES